MLGIELMLHPSSAVAELQLLHMIRMAAAGDNHMLTIVSMAVLQVTVAAVPVCSGTMHIVSCWATSVQPDNVQLARNCSCSTQTTWLIHSDTSE
jgi:hypothetical protein